MQHFRTPAYRWIRVTLFVTLGLFGVVPTAHGIWMYGVSIRVEVATVFVLTFYIYVVG